MKTEFNFEHEGRNFSADPEKVTYNNRAGHFWTFREQKDGAMMRVGKLFMPERSTKAQILAQFEWLGV